MACYSTQRRSTLPYSERCYGRRGILLTLSRYHAAYVGLSDEACFRAILNDQNCGPEGGYIQQLVRRKTDLVQRAFRASLPRVSASLGICQRCIHSVTGWPSLRALLQEIVLCLKLGACLLCSSTLRRPGCSGSSTGPYLHISTPLHGRSPIAATNVWLSKIRHMEWRLPTRPA